MAALKHQMVNFHPPSAEDPTQPKPCVRPAIIVDVNAKPAAVKVGPFKDELGEIVKVKRRWIPAAWVEPYEPKAEKPRKLKGKR